MYVNYHLVSLGLATGVHISREAGTVATQSCSFGMR